MGKMKNITIVGTGLIGGSLGLALKSRGLAGEVVGVGWRESTLIEAKRLGAIDRFTLNIAEGVAGADVVVICTPVGIVTEQAAAAIPAMKKGAILTDVASTKALITKKVEALLSGGVSFVPAHPMAGSERRGVTSARPDLFENSICILTPTDRTPPAAVQAIGDLWSSVGANVATLTPDAHDKAVAQVSHLPHLVAPALIRAVETSNLKFAGPGLRDTTRIASSDSALWLDIYKENRENVLDTLRVFSKELDELADALERSDWHRLAELLEQARAKRALLDDKSAK